MRAVAVNQLKLPPRLMEVSQPTLPPGHVLLKVAAAGINPVDWKLADGLYAEPGNFVLPFILGVDAAGTVVETGAGASRVKVGDRVFGQYFSTPRGHGTYAEYVALPENSAWAVQPADLNDEAAAALPTAGLTALGLVDGLDLKPGSKVLIAGATGGVGLFATQLAAARGFTVLVTAAAADATRLLELGASETFDHHAGDLAAQVSNAHQHGIDALLDLVNSAEDFHRLAKIVSKNGWAYSTNHVADPKQLRQRFIQGGNFSVRGDAAQLRRLAGWVVEGKLTVPIHRSIPLEAVPAAIEETKTGHARGKTVIRML